MQTTHTPTRQAECDDCGELAPLNEFSLCQPCDAAAEAFLTARMRARLNGATRGEHFIEALNQTSKGVL